MFMVFHPVTRFINGARARNDWNKVEGTLKQISVGDGSVVWGVNRRNKVFRGYVERVGNSGHGNSSRDEDGWLSLGCAKAALGRDNDVISVGRAKGRFRAIKFRVSRSKVKFYKVIVTFGNGRTQVLPGLGKLSKGRTSEVLDLKGNRRFISKITMRYKTIVGFPPREARVCVLGQN